jgi:hypothetical protein
MSCWFDQVVDLQVLLTEKKDGASLSTSLLKGGDVSDIGVSGTMNNGNELMIAGAVDCIAPGCAYYDAKRFADGPNLSPTRISSERRE